MTRPLLYSVCTGNSCRSPIAEGLARAWGEGRIEAVSGGLEAHGLNPRAVETMQEIGIDISHQASTAIDLGLLTSADYAITLCGDADERCPWTPPSVKPIHWGFPDPAKAQGTEEDMRNAVRAVRDGIGAPVRAFIEEIGPRS